MSSLYYKSRFGGVASLAALLLSGVASLAQAAPTGGFVAVVNEQNNFSDSRKCVTFFDSDEIGSGPLFSVQIPFEDGVSNPEEPQSLTVDPKTGDVYFIAFDSGTPGPGTGDGLGDFDLNKINFATVYDHWATNFKGKDVRTLTGPLAVGGPAPAGTNNMNNKDYVTYGVSRTVSFPAANSNTFVLAGSIDKIGEVARNAPTGSSNFYATSLNFVDKDTLLFVDDALESEVDGLDNVVNDKAYRVAKRISTSPGAAALTLVDRTGPGEIDYYNGGQNQGTSESWASTLLAFADRDNGTGHSEIESSDSYVDPISGVRGMWITEADQPIAGDSVSFYQIDSSGNAVGYRPFSSTGNPTQFVLDNDPIAGNDNKGKTDNIFVDKDSGDIIIVESGFQDASDGIGPDHEPGVLRRHITSYDNGSGQIEFGAWEPKVILNPMKDPGDTSLELGYFSSYDSATDTVYFFSPAFGTETPPNEMDIYSLNLTTGVTSSFLNVDESVSLFVTGTNFKPIGDKAVAFNLAAGKPGDFNNDGFVNAADYTVWRDHLGAADESSLNGNGNGTGGVDAGDYTLWKLNFGAPGSGGIAGGGTIPEPATALLMLMGMISIGLGRRGRAR